MLPPVEIPAWELERTPGFEKRQLQPVTHVGTFNMSYTGHPAPSGWSFDYRSPHRRWPDEDLLAMHHELARILAL